MSAGIALNMTAWLARDREMGRANRTRDPLGSFNVAVMRAYRKAMAPIVLGTIAKLKILGGGCMGLMAHRVGAPTNRIG
jgi:hypothetical protein